MEVAEQKDVMVPKLRFQEFTHSWETDALKKLTKYVDYRGKAPQKSEEGVFLVTAKNIKKGYIDYEKSAEYVPRELYAAIMSKGLPAVGDIVFTTEAPMGNVAQLDRSDIALAQRVIKFRSNGKISNEYLLYYMLASPFQKDIADKAIGTTVQGISGGDLHRCLVRFPTLPEQQKIAGFLSAVDEKLKHLNRKKELLQQYKKGVMQQLFAQELRFKREDGCDYEDWEEKRLGEVAFDHYQGVNTAADRVEYAPEGFPIIQAKHITGESLTFDDCKYLGEVDYANYQLKYQPKVDDILISNIGTLGKIVLVTDNIEFIIAWNIFKISVRTEKVIPKYLELSLKRTADGNFFERMQAGNATKFINKSDMLGISVPCPCLEEQQKIADFLSSLDRKIDAVSTQIEKTQQFKKGLLQELFV
jgi:type I restriction enzyme S subunit